MSADEYLSPEVREQLLETLQDMGEMLHALEELAEHRGYFDAWWSLLERMLGVRDRVLSDSIDPGFADAMEELCLMYDAFVETVLPNPTEY